MNYTCPAQEQYLDSKSWLTFCHFPFYLSILNTNRYLDQILNWQNRAIYLYIQTAILGNLSESLLGNRPPLPCLQTNNGQMTWSSSKMALILYLCNVYVQTLLKQLLPAFHVLCNWLFLQGGILTTLLRLSKPTYLCNNELITEYTEFPFTGKNKT